MGALAPNKKILQYRIAIWLFSTSLWCSFFSKIKIFCWENLDPSLYLIAYSLTQGILGIANKRQTTYHQSNTTPVELNCLCLC
jgi:hypothetical protein